MKYKLNTEVIDYTAPTGEYAYQGTKHQVKDQLIELGILVPVEEKKCCATAEADKKQFYAGFYEGVQNERAKTDKQIEEAVEGERERMFQTLLEKGFTVDKIMHDIVYDLRPSQEREA
jgi:hypothetical protein